MKTLMLSYNKNLQEDYIINPQDDDKPYLVQGFAGLINDILSYDQQISITYDLVTHQNLFSEEQRKALENIIDMHNRFIISKK